MSSSRQGSRGGPLSGLRQGARRSGYAHSCYSCLYIEILYFTYPQSNFRCVKRYQSVIWLRFCWAGNGPELLPC
jgi:hypothetical protein